MYIVFKTILYKYEITYVKLISSFLNLIKVYIYQKIEKLDTYFSDIRVSIQLHEIRIDEYNSVN